MFTDTATITVKTGRGGDGAVSFHREKYVAAGGPDGGDGGRGGDIVLKADDHLSTLADFRYKRSYSAGNGENGNGGRRTGKDGESLVIRVPRGTLVREKQSGGLMADMSDSGEFVLAKGGRGGWGNTHFASPTRQAPRFAKAGLPGREFEIVLELKLLADVGLIGFPNAGKSSLLAVMSSARPKVAGYPFTTLSPNLGVVYVEQERSFVCADIPGLIEGAAEGAGLGHAFLRHVERCRMLLHVVDIAGVDGRDPREDFDAINAELAAYSPELANRPQWVVANKTDILEDGDALERLRAHVAPLPVYPVSAATTDGVRALMSAVEGHVRTLPPMVVFEPDYAPPGQEDLNETVITREGGVWVVEGPWIERLLNDINLGELESKMYFNRRLRQNGLFDRLEELGVAEGDIINVYGTEFEYTR